MEQFLIQYRNRTEQIWDERTVSPKFLPIDTSKPRSLGQCAATSAVLMHELRAAYPDKRYALAIGQVRKDDSVAIPYHVWVVELAGTPRDNKVIDVTADQSEVLKTVIYASVERLMGEGIFYIAYETSESGRFMHDEARQRVELLQKKYEACQ